MRTLGFLIVCGAWAAATVLSEAQPAPAQMPGLGVPAGPGGSVSARAQAALAQQQAALNYAQATGNSQGEATALYWIGTIYQLEGDSPTAEGYLMRSLRIAQANGFKRGEPLVLLSLGGVNRMLSKEEVALSYLNKAIDEFRALGNSSGESNALDVRALVYFDLGQNEKCLADFNQALAMMEANGDHASEVPALNNLGRIYSALGQDDRALDVLNRALPLAQQANVRYMEGRIEKNIGVAYRDKDDAAKAFEAYGKALAIMDDLGDRIGQAMTLDEMGAMYAKQGQKQQARASYRNGIAVAMRTSEPLLEAWIDVDLMRLEKDNAPPLAIYYGKQAVNLIQQVRGGIRDLDKDVQKSFLTSKADYYDELADLLIGQGRLAEAQQVLNLLKEAEYKDYVRGETTNGISPLSLTPAELKAEEDYQQATATLVSKEQRWSELRNLPQRSPEQDNEFQALSTEMKNAGSGLNAYYARLYQLFGTPTGNDALKEIKDNSVLLTRAIAGSPHTVAIYTAVAQDRLNIIVLSGSGPAIGRKYAIGEKDLYQKIAAFQHALRTPSSDPRPMAQELYSILIGPIQADLDQAKAETLVWSLDGALRYVPLAALYDGKHYVVERYNLVTFTPASFPNLQNKPDLAHISAVAMGISRKYQEGLNPLPSVVGELDDVVKDPKVSQARGVLPGTILLDGQFTEKAMESELAAQRAVVHIASHFVLEPGDDNESYLLLAGKDSAENGYHLTVADFRDDQNMDLNSTELLTLSACETGVNSQANNGREVDGLAATAQIKGAKAVLSTLWPVNDASTGRLMADFYRRWTDGAGKVSKAEALRQAQLDLLTGKDMASGTGKRGLSTDDEAGTATGGLSHPFYWAPFVLAGNWK